MQNNKIHPVLGRKLRENNTFYGLLFGHPLFRKKIEKITTNTFWIDGRLLNPNQTRKEYRGTAPNRWGKLQSLGLVPLDF